MGREKCKKYEKCEAPLCPLDEVSLNHGIWYPNEEICSIREYQQLLWIKNQKKIAKKTSDFDTYYTVEMLNRKFVITKAIKGLDPDGDYKKELKKWLKAHKPYKKREVSEEERKRMSDRLKNIAKFR